MTGVVLCPVCGAVACPGHDTERAEPPAARVVEELHPRDAIGVLAEASAAPAAVEALRQYAVEEWRWPLRPAAVGAQGPYWYARDPDSGMLQRLTGRIADLAVELQYRLWRVTIPAETVMAGTRTPRVCEACEGTGSVVRVAEDAAGQARRVRVACEACTASGIVPVDTD